MNLQYVYSRYEEIFITGGLGDVFLLESFFSNEMRNVLKTINFATRTSNILINLLNIIPKHIFPNLKNLNVIHNNFSEFWCFFSKPDFIKRMPKLSNKVENSIDWSIAVIFPYIRHKILKFNGSSFVKHKIIDIDKFDLPLNYLAIAPYSTDKRMKNRDFSNKDWDILLNKLEERNIIGVVLDTGNNGIPKSNNLINLQNKTNLAESIEIVKNSKGYIGIDSCLSVIASFVHDNNIMVKSVNQHLYNCKDIYFYTKKNFDFIVKEIR